MAGRRQHIIPQFMLRNFAAKKEHGNIFTWVYRIRKEPFCTNIKNAAVEADFYGKGNDPVGADETMTLQEGSFANLLSKLLAHPSDIPIQEPDIGAFIGHTVARTKNLRLSFAECAVALISELQKHLGRPDVLKSLVIAHLEKAGTIDALLDQHLPPELNHPSVRKQFRGIVIEKFPEFFDQYEKLLRQEMNETFQQILSTASDASRDGHIKALREFTVDCPTAAFWNKMQWQVIESSTTLVLGDSICLFKMLNDPSLRPFPENQDLVERVFLPLSPKRLLIGKKTFHGQDLDFGEINRWSAICSREYFVCSCGPEQHKNIQLLIGEGASFFPRETIVRVIDELIARPAGSPRGS